MALNATACPVPIVVSPFLSRAGATPNHAVSFTPGQVTVTPSLNQNAVYLDQLAICGGSNLAAIISGLALSAGSGLQILCATGWALCGGVIEVGSALNVALTASTTNYIWLLPSGALSKTTTLSPPASQAIYLGAVVTSSTAVTSIDYSGVLYLQGSMPVRTCGDSGTPGDTPPAGTWFATKTGGGLYLWDGSAYHHLA